MTWRWPMTIPKGSRNNNFNFMGMQNYLSFYQAAIMAGNSPLTAADYADECCFLLQARVLDDGPGLTGPDEKPMTGSKDEAMRAYRFNCERHEEALSVARKAAADELARKTTQNMPEEVQ